MREFKFRAWFTHLKEMKPVAMSTVYEGNKSLLHLPHRPLSRYEPIELMQYTGLRDQNSSEIFEGDIITTEFGNRVVYWHDKFACWAVTNFGDSLHLFHDDAEVIGNIYENPELLSEVIE
jgi:hypothetical protein